ncbi:hypothetical protein KC323_g18 [Hortaea werneckii]|nr:hypothetical protein KC323_g18 [Hortaea werneckii]
MSLIKLKVRYQRSDTTPSCFTVATLQWPVSTGVFAGKDGPSHRKLCLDVSGISLAAIWKDKYERATVNCQIQRLC